MNFRTACLIVVAVAVSIVAPNVRADDKDARRDAPPAAPPRVTLKVGDPAPPLRIGRWLKGEPIKALEPGKVYIVECWASWCAPCVAAMPHMTRLQGRYRDKGVVVIGLNVLERDPAAAEPFVQKMGDKIGYPVVTDDLSSGPPGRMVESWLHAAGRKGLPWSFLVDRRGRIAWMGFPMMIDRPLAALAEDRFDPAEQAKYEAELNEHFDAYASATKARDDDKALTTLDRLIALVPSMAPQYSTTRLSVLLRKGDYAAANAQARALLGDETTGDDPSLRATAANVLLNADDVSRIDTALAVTLARSAYDARGGEGWQYAALLARAHAADRRYDEAVELQTRAVVQAPESAREREEKTLAEYKQKASTK